MSKTTSLIAALALAAAALPAQADVFIGLQQAGVAGGAIQTVASSATGAAGWLGPYGTYEVNSISVTGKPIDSDLLNSTALNLATHSAGTIRVYVSSTGNTDSGLGDVFTSLTSNVLPAGWTSALDIYWSASDTEYALDNFLAGHTFSGIGVYEADQVVDLPALFSVTGVYTVTSIGFGAALSTLHVTAIPEPSTLLLALTAFGATAAAFMVRRRAR